MTNDNAVTLSTPHELIVSFLEKECSFPPAEYAALSERMKAWAERYSGRAAVNEFNPIMLLEQIRKEFDENVPFVSFALVAADLQWGPRMMKLGQFDKPVWVLALQGFPSLIAEAKKFIEQGNSGG